MIKRYDASIDEMVELTQEYYDKQMKFLKTLSENYKSNNPENFNKFYDDYVLGKVN